MGRLLGCVGRSTSPSRLLYLTGMINAKPSQTIARHSRLQRVRGKSRRSILKEPSFLCRVLPAWSYSGQQQVDKIETGSTSEGLSWLATELRK